MGSTGIRKLQFGKETTWGTSVAATAVFMGIDDMRIKPVVNNTQRRYLTGSYQPAHSVVQTHKHGEASFSGDFTFEDLIYVLLSGVKGAVTPTGAGTDKTWVFPFQTTASPAVEPRTLEMYDGQQEYELGGGVVSSFDLSGAATADGVVRFSSSWMGKEVVKSTLTANQTTRTVEALPASMMKLYADDLGGTIGTTEYAASLISWTLNCRTGVHLKQFQSGAITPSSFGDGVPDVTLGLTLEFNANGVAEVDKWIAGTGRLIRLKGLGSLITGSTYKTLQIDMAGDITDISELWGDRDGNTTVDVTIKPRYDAGAFANYSQITVINAVATAVG